MTTYKEWAMVYAVSPGEAWGADMVKIGAHQSSSMAMAVKELCGRHGTNYPDVRILHLCFTATHKIAAEDVVKRELRGFRHSGEVYGGLGAGLEEALQAVYTALEVPMDAAYEHPLPPGKRDMLEAAGDVAAVKRARLERRTQNDIARAAKREMRLRAEREAVEATEREVEAARLKREKRERDAEAVKLAREGDDVGPWANKCLQMGEGRVLTLKEAHDSYRAHGGKLGKINFAPRLKHHLTAPFVIETHRAGAYLKNFWDGVGV